MIDLRSGDRIHRVRGDGVMRELYDTVILSGIARPMAQGFKADKVCRTVSIGPVASL